MAMQQGGAIYYDLYRPYMSNNKFQNNEALYGNNIASYPVKIRLKDSESDDIILNDAPSGQVYSPTLQFELVDHDNQVISIDNTSSVSIKAIDTNASVRGFAQSVVNEGLANFDQLILQAKPGSQNIEIEISSLALDLNKLSLQYNKTFNQSFIQASFRYCQSGEIERNGVCEVCSPGLYSLGVNKTECLN